jgi:hypothetical protein
MGGLRSAGRKDGELSIPGVASPGALATIFKAINRESAGVEDERIGRAFWPSSLEWWIRSC